MDKDETLTYMRIDKEHYEHLIKIQPLCFQMFGYLQAMADLRLNENANLHRLILDAEAILFKEKEK